MSSLIPCLLWVKKGAAKEIPEKVKLSKDQIAELIQDTAEQQLKELNEEESPNVTAETSREAGKERFDGTDQEDIGIEELYDLENYDVQDDPEVEEMEGDIGKLGAGFSGITLYASNEEDPYITLKEVESSDEEDFRIYSTDNLICSGKADEELSSIEVNVYIENESHHYCHHEILLGAFPLALEWMDFDPDDEERKGSMLAVGTMEPVIEVWDLDLVDAPEPVVSLGQKSKKKKRKKEKQNIIHSHTDAVMALAWNRNMRNVLASGSADCSVIVWDLKDRTVLLSLAHPDKVQSVQWHPYEPQTLVSGCFDKCARVFDGHKPDEPRCWQLGGEVERVLWNHFHPETFLASTENGFIFAINRTQSSPIFTIQAHDKAVSDISLSCFMPGLLVSASSDRTMKVWDIQDDTPAFLYSKDLKMGELYAAKCSPDSPYCVAVGGAKDGLRVVGLERIDDVYSHFKGRAMLQATMPQKHPHSITTPESVAMEEHISVSKEGLAQAIAVPGHSQGETSLLKKTNKKKKKKKKK